MVRTIAVIGASNTGKSTLVDRMCALEGQPFPAAAPGELRVATFGHLGESWQAIDTPGSIELLHVAADALLAADAAVVCVGPDPTAALLASPYLHAVEAAGTPALIFINGKVSLGHLGAGYLVLFLIGSAAIAISLFASTISPNQLIAGVTGALFTVTLLVLWMVADVVAPPFKEIFHYLSIHNKHFTPFSQGIVHTRDVIYYLSVIVFFLECSVRALEARRWRG